MKTMKFLIMAMLCICLSSLTSCMKSDGRSPYDPLYTPPPPTEVYIDAEPGNGARILVHDKAGNDAGYVGCSDSNNLRKISCHDYKNCGPLWVQVDWGYRSTSDDDTYYTGQIVGVY